MTTVRPFDTYYYGASLVPDEDDLKQTEVKYALIQDPTGFQVEVKENPTDSHCRIVINVIDLDESIDFYTKIIGLKLLRKRSNVNSRPRDASISAYVGGLTETNGVILELFYQYATNTINQGNSFEQASEI